MQFSSTGQLEGCSGMQLLKPPSLFFFSHTCSNKRSRGADALPTYGVLAIASSAGLATAKATLDVTQDSSASSQTGEVNTRDLRVVSWSGANSS